MSTRPAERHAVLVISVWIEGNPATGLRARITQAEVSSGASEVVTTTDAADEVFSTVKTWLEDFIAGSR